MAKAQCKSSATAAADNYFSDRILIEAMSKRYGITELKAARLIVKYRQREKEQHFVEGWWVELLEAQFQPRIGSHRRIRCGDEVNLVHLIPEATGLCHDCGCAPGEFHVFGCDSEECSNCGEQAFCCDCGDTEQDSVQLK